MEMLKMISEEEMNMIENYIDDYAGNSEMNVSRTVSGEYLLREWNRAKSEYLGNIFKDELIFSRDVVFKMSDEQLEKEMIVKFYDDNRDISNLLADFCAKIQYGIGKNDDKIFYGMTGLLRTQALISNIYDGDTFEVPLENGKTLKINHGAKTIKALGKIAAAFPQDFDAEAMEHLRIVHSQVLNQRALRGNLCLSIHPLDYMTMSDNECGWSSCMSWQDGGCYRQGTVEMMNSPMVVVAYLKAKDDMKIRGGYWSNKKWRELYIVSPKMISNVKAYPYRNDILTSLVLDWLKELATTAGIGNYDETITTWDMDEAFVTKNEKHYCISPRTYNMYNDFDNNNNQLAYIGDALEEGYYVPNYSGASECMYCGELNPDFYNEEYLIGECCDETYACEYCGNRFREELMYELDGELYCEYCYDSHAVEDSITGEIHHRDSFSRIFLLTENGERLYNSFDLNICSDSIEEFKNKYMNGPLFDIEIFYNESYAIFPSQLTTKGLELFGYDTLEELNEELNKSHGWKTHLTSEVIKETKKYLLLKEAS